MKRSLLILIHPITLALVITAIVIIFLLPDFSSNYILKNTKSIVWRDKTQVYYDDLDEDGQSESIFTHYNSGLLALIVKKDEEPIHEWTLSGDYINNRARIFFGDYNKNKKHEVYIVTCRNDSLFLNAFEPFGDTISFLLKNYFLDVTPTPSNGQIQVNCIPGKITDLDGDHYGEAVFAIIAGYTCTPRKVYAVNINKKEKKTSPLSGAVILNLKFVDIDKDHKDEIFLNTYSCRNIDDPKIPYSDYKNWMMVLDNDLEFLFPPKGFECNYGKCFTFPILSHNKYLIFNYSMNASINEGMSSIRICNLDGQELIKKILSGRERKSLSFFTTTEKKSNRLFQMDMSNNKLTELDDNLDTIQSRYLKNSGDFYQEIDADKNGKLEYIFTEPQSNNFLIFDNSLQTSCIIKNYGTDYPVIQQKINKGNLPEISFMFQDFGSSTSITQNIISTYTINPVFSWRYLIYLCIFLVVLGILLLTRIFQRIQLKKRYQVQQKIAELQLLSIRNQMDPHFTFNVINTIHSAALTVNKEEVRTLTHRFSQLIRMSLEQAENITIPLKVELEFINNYLEIQLFRYPKQFSWEIDIPDDIDPNRLVPRMVVHNFVENALKHGILPSRKEGKITINVVKEDNKMLLIITDNGLGYKHVSKSFNSDFIGNNTGKGLSLVQNTFDLFNRFNRNKIFFTISNLNEEDIKSEGTKVVIHIPDHLEFSIFK